MSRFFAGGLLDSDSDSSEELLSSSSEDELMSSGSDNAGGAAAGGDDDSDLDDFPSGDDDSDELDSSDDGRSRTGPSYFLKRSFLKGGSDLEDLDDDRKVVKLAKDKMLDEMRDTANALTEARRRDDWVVVLENFDKCQRLLAKNQLRIGVPNFYIKALAQMEDALVEQLEQEKESKKKLPALVAKALNTLRQRHKKQSKELLPLLAKFREDPELFDQEEPVSVQASSAATPVPESAGSRAGAAGAAAIFTALQTIAELRGKKNVDRLQQIRELEELLADATTPFERILVYLMLIPIRFDVLANQAFMAIEAWQKLAANISGLYDVLELCTDLYQLVETAHATDALNIPPQPNAQGVREMLGSGGGFVERLDDEFGRLLQYIDQHLSEYTERLKDEPLVYGLLLRAQLYAEATTPVAERLLQRGEQLARTLLRRLLHVYYKPALLVLLGDQRAWAQLPQKNADLSVAPRPQDDADADVYGAELVDGLCKVLYLHTNLIFRKRAMLLHIYYYAKNNQFYKARDMFLMLHLQSTIHTLEPQVQVLFNRALVQLGLCAFRDGLVLELQQILAEIATLPRVKELLGQGVQKYSGNTLAADRQRTLPYHMHINLELLEAVYLTGSMLVEVAVVAQTLGDPRKRVLAAKLFRRQLEFYDRQYYTGPPENTRDTILHAAKALQRGDWQKAHEWLCLIKIWLLFTDVEGVKDMLRTKVQVEGLRTYIFTFKLAYDTLLLPFLAKHFGMLLEDTTAVVTRMIHADDLCARLNQKTQLLVFLPDQELTKLQELALTLTDKIGLLAEKNERIAAGGHMGPPRDLKQLHKQYGAAGVAQKGGR